MGQHMPVERALFREGFLAYGTLTILTLSAERRRRCSRRGLVCRTRTGARVARALLLLLLLPSAAASMQVQVAIEMLASAEAFRAQPAFVREVAAVRPCVR